MATARFPSTVPVAGLYGSRIDAAVYRRGSLASGRPVYGLCCPGVDEPPHHGDDHREFRLNRSLDTYRETIDGILGWYEASGRFTETQLRTLRAIWRNLESVRSFARWEGVSRQAILCRIEGKKLPNGKHWGRLLSKAPEFARAWPLIKAAQGRLGAHGW